MVVRSRPRPVDHEEIDMRRYLVLLPAPEAEWAKLPPEEHQKGLASHGQFHEDLAAGGHRIIAVSPLEPSAQATSMRPDGNGGATITDRSEEHTSELQSLMRISYAVFCVKQKKHNTTTPHT